MLLCLVLVFALNMIFHTFRFGLPFVRTPRWAVRQVIEHIDIHPGDVVYELGCGDARVLALMATTFPLAHYYGVEAQWFPYLLARWRTRRLTNVSIQLQNFFNTNLSSATLVYGFFITSLMPQLTKKFSQELKPGATVISFGFGLPGWTPTREVADPSGKRASKIRFYTQT